MASSNTLSLACLLSLILLAPCHAAAGVPPHLFRAPNHQSVVHGDPDDLLLLAGSDLSPDDVVVYRLMDGASHTPSAPRGTPARSTRELGTAEIVSTGGSPTSLVVKLPANLQPGAAYALWVRSAAGTWSEAVTINDARPRWITPSYAYSTQSVASLPRMIKIVGRNLQPIPGASTRIRLRGPQLIEDVALTDPAPTHMLEEYLARMRLPPAVVPGRYQVELSRDDRNWVAVPDQLLEVLPDPPPNQDFSVADARFGGCRADDDNDDTPCIIQAVAAAARGGGSVVFGPGVWDLKGREHPGTSGADGISLPRNVSLRADGAATTTLVRHAEWNGDSGDSAVFTLHGNSVISGFTFRDLTPHHARTAYGPFLKLGSRVTSANFIDDIRVTGNVFDRPAVAIGSIGLPMRRLFITYNTFGAFNSALELKGDRFDAAVRFRIDDAVIAHNLFEPGSKLDLQEKTGAIASEIGGGLRLDFSDNTADGSSAEHLDAPEDAYGWRAAFFWNMDGNVENTLVSHNTATCTGDKIGDGEAIAFDNNANTFALRAATTAVRSSADAVVIGEPLAARQNGVIVPASSYYLDHWLQVVSGPGLGQARKIVAYDTDSTTGLTTFRVAPQWDVPPVAGRTRIAIGREFWQLYVLANHVDNRRPLCRKSNRSRPRAGGIVLWAQSADSVIAGNEQFDSDGIAVQQVYIVPEHACEDCTMQSMFQTSLELRDNFIDGEYDWNNDCSESGIVVGVAASPWGNIAPPTVGFGVSISHNRVRHADALHGGAIAQLNSWFAGPDPRQWPLSESMLIHHNSIADIAGPRAMPVCGKSRPRVGIGFPDYAIAWHTVIYANSCNNVDTPLGAGGVDTRLVCPSTSAGSCECPAAPR